MKVLFLSHYKNNDRFGLYAQGLMLALHKSGVEIVFRHISNGQNESNKLHPVLLPLDQDPLIDCTHCIQFLQPEYLLGTKKFTKNIAIVLEPKSSNNDLELMDEVWVFSDNAQKELSHKFPNVKIRSITPVFTEMKDKIAFIYDNNRKIEFEDFSLSSVGTNMKEALSA